MLQKNLLHFLSDKKELDISSIYKHLHITTPKEKKNIQHYLKQWEQYGAININLKKGIIKIVDLSLCNPHSNVVPRHIKPILTAGKVEDDFILVKDRYSLPQKFSFDTIQEIKEKIWEKSQDTYRQDLKKEFVITIDGEDSKDLDDAISIKKHFFGKWTLGVHIADVSYYVPQNSILDQEAYKRANSYYFINQVIPMLPKELSNDLCSLNPKENKRTLSVFITFNKNGEVLKYNIIPTWICSNYRLTYQKVQEIMNNQTKTDPVLQKNINLMKEFYKILYKKRINNGSIDFNFKERKIILDKDGNPTKIYQKDRLDSERLIEEFMLSANQAIGDFLTKKKLGLFRIHDTPPPEKYKDLKKFASKLGVKLPDIPRPQDIQLFLASLETSPLKMSGEVLVLRSMAQAVYHRENIGHFGLGFPLYAHFTSPIRRYADLIVHRLIKFFLFSSHNTKQPYTEKELDKIAQHISVQERIAMEAERDFFKIKAARYMKPYEGQEFAGIISSVANFGIFVEMEGTGIEAMIRYSAMNDYMIFDEENLLAKNKRGSKIYRLGDKVRIRITKVNTERCFIDAEFINP